MSRFLDGPAAGADVTHFRVPHFLRVVIDAAGTVDVLDQLDDTPRAGERVFVYRRVAGTLVRPIHVLIREPGGRRGGWASSADYRHVASVDGEQLRDTAAWRTWADLQPREPSPDDLDMDSDLVVPRWTCGDCGTELDGAGCWRCELEAAADEDLERGSGLL